MYKWYQVLVQDLDENVDENLKDLDENLAWLAQKTEDPKGILHHFLHQPPLPFQVYPPFLAKNVVPPPRKSDSIFGRSYSPPPPHVATTFNLKKNTAIVLRRSNKMLLKPLHCYHQWYKYCYIMIYRKLLHCNTQNHSFYWFHGANKAKKIRTLSQ